MGAGISLWAIFENGHRTSGDLIIAADGIRSQFRKQILNEPVEPKYAGYINWNGLVPADEKLAPKNTWSIYVGEHKRASLMPVGDSRCYFFLDVPLSPDNSAEPAGYQAELKEHFQGWDTPVQQLIDRLNPAETARIAIHDMGPIDRYVRGRVALLGDAAHATCPDLGQGGCQALEDAWVLSNYLIATNKRSRSAGDRLAIG